MDDNPLFSSVPYVTINRGISSDGRAPALHAEGTGIDTQILQFLFLIPSLCEIHLLWSLNIIWDY